MTQAQRSASEAEHNLYMQQLEQNILYRQQFVTDQHNRVSDTSHYLRGKQISLPTDMSTVNYGSSSVSSGRD